MGALGGSRELCNHYCRTGRCKHESNCKYVHDRRKVQICRSFLRGECGKEGNECDLSHDDDPNRTPECGLFLRNLCVNPKCKYLHVKKSTTAPECELFITSWCPLGTSCPKRHYTPPSGGERKRTRDDPNDHREDDQPSEDEDTALHRIWNDEPSLKFYM